MDASPEFLDPNKPFRLSAPLTTHSGEVMELTLKMPKAKTFMKYGMPYRVGADGEVIPDVKTLMGFASDMTGVDSILLENMEGSDVMPFCFLIIRKLRYDPSNG